MRSHPIAAALWVVFVFGCCVRMGFALDEVVRCNLMLGSDLSFVTAVYQNAPVNATGNDSAGITLSFREQGPQQSLSILTEIVGREHSTDSTNQSTCNVADSFVSVLCETSAPGTSAWEGFRSSTTHWRVCSKSADTASCPAPLSSSRRRTPCTLNASSSVAPIYTPFEGVGKYVNFEGSPYGSYGFTVHATTSNALHANVFDPQSGVLIYILTESGYEKSFFSAYSLFDTPVSMGETVSAYVRTRTKPLRISLVSYTHDRYGFWILSAGGVIIAQDPNGPEGTPFFPLPPNAFWIENDNYYRYPTTSFDFPSNFWEASQQTCDYFGLQHVDVLASACDAIDNETVCTIVCEYGYHVEGRSRNATTQTVECSDTVFAEEVRACVALTCDTPPSGAHVNQTAMSNCVGESGTLCDLICDSGFSPGPGTQIECALGEWDFTAAICAKWGDREYGWPTAKIVCMIIAALSFPMLFALAYFSDACCAPLHTFRAGLPAPLWCLLPSPSDYMNTPFFSLFMLESVCRSRRCFTSKQCLNPMYWMFGRCDCDVICCVNTPCARRCCRRRGCIRKPTLCYFLRWFLIVMFALGGLLFLTFHVGDSLEAGYWQSKPLEIVGGYSVVSAKNKEILKWGGFCVGSRPNRQCSCDRDGYWVSSCHMLEYGVSWNCSSDETPPGEGARICTSTLRDFRNTMVTGPLYEGFGPLNLIDEHAAVGSYVQGWVDCGRPNGGCTARQLGGKGTNGSVRNGAIVCLAVAGALLIVEYLRWVSLECLHERRKTASVQMLRDIRTFETMGPVRVKELGQPRSMRVVREIMSRARHSQYFFSVPLPKELVRDIRCAVADLVADRTRTHWGRARLFFAEHRWAAHARIIKRQARSVIRHSLRALRESPDAITEHAVAMCGGDIEMQTVGSDSVATKDMNDEVADRDDDALECGEAKRRPSVDEDAEVVEDFEANREDQEAYEALVDEARVAQQRAQIGGRHRLVAYGCREMNEIDPNLLDDILPEKKRTRLVDDSDEEKEEEEEDADGESDPHAVSWMNRVLFDGFDIGSDVERDISRVDLRATVERGTHWVPAEFKFSPHSGGVGTWLTPIAGVKASDRQAKDVLARTLSSVVGHLERVMSMPLIGRVVPVVVKTTTFHVLPGGFAVHGWRRSGPRDRGAGACIVAVYDHFGVAGGSLQLSRVKENDDVDIFNARRVDLSPTLLRNGHAVVFGNPDRVWWRFSKIDALPMHKILLANRESGDDASRSSRRVHSSQRLMHGDETPSADLQSLVGMIKYVEFVVFAPVRSSARKTGRVYSQSHRYAVSGTIPEPLLTSRVRNVHGRDLALRAIVRWSYQSRPCACSMQTTGITPGILRSILLYLVHDPRRMWIYRKLISHYETSIERGFSAF